MRVKDAIAEDFLNYKLPALFIASAFCDWKCCRENGLDEGICQNRPLADARTVDISIETIYDMFENNDITKAVVIGGLEPMLQFDETLDLIRFFRDKGENCPFVIYTGYYESEIQSEITKLRQFENIIVKFGRYIPGKPERYDPVLGVALASDNQFAMEIS